MPEVRVNGAPGGALLDADPHRIIHIQESP
jgi:hypothetical protein